MAIPFFEPKNAAVEPIVVDQVDGPGGHSSSPALPIPVQHAVGNTNEPSLTSSPPPTHNNPSATADAAEQLLAWQILALAMCKALKEYYLQSASSADAFTSAVVQILPNGQVQAMWK